MAPNIPIISEDEYDALMGQDSYQGIPIVSEDEYEAGLSKEPTDSDSNWLDSLYSIATALPKKTLSGILDTAAGFYEASADRKRNMPEDFFAGQEDFTADPQILAKFGIIPPITRPVEDRGIAQSARQTAKDLSQSVDTDLGLDENSWVKRGLDVTGQMVPALGLSFINPLLGAGAFGIQGYGQKYNQLAQLTNPDGTPAVSPDERANTSAATGLMSGAFGLLPIKVMGGSTGNVVSRLGKEYAKQVGVNSVLNPLQVVGDALIDSNLAGVDRTSGLGDALIQSEKDALLMSLPFAGAGAFRRGRAPTKVPTIDDFMTKLDDVGTTANVSPRQQVGLPEQDFAPYISDAEVPVVRGRPQVSDDPVAQIGRVDVESPLIEIPDAPNTKSPEDLAFAQQIRDEIAVANEDIAARRAAREANEPIRAREEIFLPEDSELYTLRESVDPSMFDNQAAVRQGRQTQQAPYPVKPITNRGTIDKRMAPSEQNIAEHVIETSPKRVFRSETEDIIGQADEQIARKAENIKPNRSPFVEDDGVIKLNEAEESFPKPIIDPTRTEPKQLITEETAPVTEGPAIIPGDEGYSSARPIEVADVPVERPSPLDERVLGEQRGLFDRRKTVQDPLIPSDDPSFVMRKAQDETVKALRRQYNEEIAKLEEAASLPEFEQKQLGIEPGNPDSITQRITELKQSRARLSNWKNDPELRETVKTNARRDVEDGTFARRKVNQRISNRLQKAVDTKELGGTTLPGDLWKAGSWLFKKAKDEAPKFEALSRVNQEYNKIWAREAQWITTTKSRNPVAAPAIEAYQRLAGDMNTMVFDSNLALQPVKELPRASQDTVYNFLAAVRVKSNQRGERYNITEDFAKRFGLSPEESRAAVSVDKMYQDRLNDFEGIIGEEIATERFIQTKRISEAEQVEIQQAKTLEQQLEVTKKYQKARQQLENELGAWEKSSLDALAEMRKGNYIPFGRSGNFFITLKDADGKTVERYQFEKRDASFEKASRELSQYAKQNNLMFDSGEMPPPKLGSRDGLDLGDGSVFGAAETQGLNSDILGLLEPSPLGEPVGGFPKYLKASRLPDFVRGANVDLYRQAAEYSMSMAKYVAMRRAKLALRRELAGDLGSVDNRNLARKVTRWASRFHDNDGKAFAALNKAFDIEFIGGTPRPAILDLISAPPMHALTVSKYLPTGVAEWVGAKGYTKTLAFLSSKGPMKPLFKKAQPDLYNYLQEQVRRGNLSNRAWKEMKRVARGDGKIMKGIGVAHDLYFSMKAGSEHIVDASNHILGWEVYPHYRKRAGKSDTRTRAQFAEDFAREAKAVPAPGDTNAIARNPAVRLVKKYKDYMFKIVDRVFQDKVDQTTGYEISTARRTEMLTKFALASWFMSGVYGVPGVRDAVNIARSLGKEPEGDLREKIGNQDAARLALYGVPTNLTGWDLASGSGWGEIFPEVRQGFVNRFVSGLIGAPGEKATKAVDAYSKGEYLKAAANIPFEPQLMSNILKGVDMYDRGVLNADAFGVVPKDEVSAFDIGSRVAGLNTLKIKEAQVQRNMIKRAEGEAGSNENINRKIGVAEATQNFDTANYWRQYAIDNGIRYDERRIKDFRNKAMGLDSKPSKAARERVATIEQLFGNALRD